MTTARSVAARLGIDEKLALVDRLHALGVPLAAGVLYPITGWLLSPMIAALAMSLSSVSVITQCLETEGTKVVKHKDYYAALGVAVDADFSRSRKPTESARTNASFPPRRFTNRLKTLSHDDAGVKVATVRIRGRRASTWRQQAA